MVTDITTFPPGIINASYSFLNVSMRKIHINYPPLFYALQGKDNKKNFTVVVKGYCNCRYKFILKLSKNFF